MIYPIVAYGDPVLRKKATDIPQDFPDLNQLIDDMFETMYGASGIGLAAPQIGKPIRLFIVDATPFEDDQELSKEDRAVLSEFKKVFINAEILEERGDEWVFNEGCLSIPDIREDVFRKTKSPYAISTLISMNTRKFTLVLPLVLYNTNTITSRGSCLPTTCLL